MSDAYHPATYALQAVIAQSNVLERELARLLGLNATDYRALSALQQFPGDEAVTMSRLGSALGATAATTSAIVDRLERSGYARRNRTEADRRLVTIEPTPQTWQRIVEIMRPLMSDIDAWIKHLRPEEAHVVTAFLNVTTSHLTEHAAALAARAADR